MNEKEFCAGLPADGGLIPGAKTIYKGDSGGTLVCNIDGYITFASVLSRQTPFEDNCGTDGHLAFSAICIITQNGFNKVFIKYFQN